MHTIDANVFLRTLAAHQPDHGTCRTLLNQLQARATPIIVPRLLLNELAAGVRRTTGDAIRARVFAELWRTAPHLQFLPLDAPLEQAATEIAADYGLRGADAIYVAVARQYSCTLVTLDHEIERRAGSIVTVQSPAAALASLSPP